MADFKARVFRLFQMFKLPRHVFLFAAVITLAALLVTTSAAVAITSSNSPVEFDPTKLPSPLKNLTASIGGTVELGNVKITTTDKEVIYQFDSANNVNVTLTDLTRDLDMQLLDSGSGEWARSVNPGTANESINEADLPQDTYTVRIYKPDIDTSAGTFTLRASNNDPANLLARENGFPKVPVLQNPIILAGAVGVRDTSDLYRFNFPNSSSSGFRVRLEGLTRNADLRLIKETNALGNRAGIIDSDEVLQTATNSGAQSELLIQAPAAAGDYFIQVESPNSGDPTQSRATRYKLTIERV
jgi:hypothetical protein